MPSLSGRWLGRCCARFLRRRCKFRQVLHSAAFVEVSRLYLNIRIYIHIYTYIYTHSYFSQVASNMCCARFLRRRRKFRRVLHSAAFVEVFRLYLNIRIYIHTHTYTYTLSLFWQVALKMFRALSPAAAQVSSGSSFGGVGRGVSAIYK